MSDNKQTEEEIQAEAKALAEKRMEEWEKFLETLKKDPDSPITKGELVKTIEFFSEDLQAVGQLIGMNSHNSQVLHHNFQQLAQVLQQGQPVQNTSPGGIILPG